ncbi:hypothetical protein MRX96_054695 [Rhipicephalus microplus]
MRFTRLPAQLSGGGPTAQLPSTRVVFALLIASSVFITTVADGDSASSSLHSEHHRDDPSLSCPPDDQCDTKKWCSAIAAVIADDKKSGAADDEYDHGVKCLDEQVVDRCGCCRECVRGSPGLPCGGIRRLGVCAAPLECLADVAVGRIAEPHEEGTCHERNCSAIACPAVASKPCPEDSYALPSQVSPQELLSNQRRVCLSAERLPREGLPARRGAPPGEDGKQQARFLLRHLRVCSC